MPRQRAPDQRPTRRVPSPAATDRHAPAALRPPAERLPKDLYYRDPDLDEFCVLCTPAWSGTRWAHSGECPARLAASR